MSIINIKQDFSVTQENKKKYGEVHTDFKLINKILDIIPNKYFTDPTLKWLDPCAGRGYFTIGIFNRLFKGLKVIKNKEKRRNHIIKEMLFINEINNDYIINLKNIFGEKSNITNFDFLKQKFQQFDFIVGNPPYNSYEFKNQSNYNSMWQTFTKKSIESLRPGGFLCYIMPSIWMKKSHVFFDYMLEFDIQKIFTLNTLETKKEFHGEAQVPTCYFLLKNTKNTKKTKIYDQINKKYIRFVPNNTSLPLNTVSIIKKLQKYVKKYGCLKVEKTNIRPERVKKLTLSNDNTNNCIYPNIYTCKLTKIKPYLDIKYSNIKLPYYGEKKIVLAHKMYGFPYYDKDGIYGICGRDNFVILNKSDYEFVRLKQFLSSKLFLSLTETTRYRMTYLEKVLFDFIPDITKIKDFPDIITNESINKYFGLDKLEIDILNSHKKIYLLDKI